MTPNEIAKMEATKALLDRASNLPTSVDEIKDDDAFANADALLADVRTLLAEAQELRLSITRPMDARKAEIMAYFRDTFETKLGDVVDALVRAIRIYQGERDRKAAEAAARAAEKARKKQARLDAKAARLAAEGKDEQAANVRTEADSVVAPTPAKTASPKSATVQRRANWTFEIVDASALPREYLMPNEQAIRGVVKALKQSANIPGVRVYDANSLDALKGA